MHLEKTRDLIEEILNKTVYVVGSVYEQQGYKEWDYLLTPLKHPFFLIKEECQHYVDELNKKSHLEILQSYKIEEMSDYKFEPQYYVAEHDLKIY